MPGGRIPTPITQRVIDHGNKKYVIGQVISKNNDIYFLIDFDDFEKVKQRNWYVTSMGYICSHYRTEDGKRHHLLLHNFVMNRLTFPGKGAAESVDHINRNPLDNRKENLRIVSQTEQNLNQKKKPRNRIALPENCGIDANNIPRHIWQIKPNGGHGDRFAIEFKTENLTWKSSSSVKLTLQQKLEQAKAKLTEFYVLQPYLNQATNDTHKQAQELSDSFTTIIGL